MKIDVSRIVIDHFRTLRNAETQKASMLDLLVFFFFPIALGSVCFWYGLSVTTEFYNVSITFFGIFIALLLNMQVAVFGIFLRRWELPKDDKLADVRLRKMSQRNLLLKEINANISYLVLLSCICLILFLIMFARSYDCGVSPAIAVVLYSHFIFTLLMVVKRAHALFQSEYSD